MQNSKRITFLFVIGMILSLGLAGSVLAEGGEKKKKNKRPKNTGILSVTTSPNALPVVVDGQRLGMSGVGDAAEFYLTPGLHVVEVQGPNGKNFRKEVEIRKNKSTCICLRVDERTTSKPCPYDMRVSGPETVTEGDLATFVASNVASVSPIAATALNYAWKVSPSSARITSGLGTNAITVDTTGLGDRTLMVELEVTDGVYDASCRQRIAVDTNVKPQPKVEVPVPIRFDQFEFRSFDDDKARLDNLAIELQNNPTYSAYIIMYQGTDRRSQRSGKVEVLSRRAIDYLVKVRGIDPSRVQIVRGDETLTTTYQFWIIPPGAEYPSPGLR